ncbi:cell wall protein DAN4, partial [Biomphalaria glabrata]
VECERLNSSLAEFESREQPISIYSKVYPFSYWIGVYDYKRERSWVWISDNKTVNMSYWVDTPENLSNDPCGYVYSYGDPGISVEDCTTKEFYICMSL